MLQDLEVTGQSRRQLGVANTPQLASSISSPTAAAPDGASSTGSEAVRRLVPTALSTRHAPNSVNAAEDDVHVPLKNHDRDAKPTVGTVLLVTFTV